MNSLNLIQVQNTVLDIYKAIKTLCDDNDIHYYAIGGTAIGTMRHKGFIPWDDDIDIAMPRKDYEKFKILARKLPKHLNFIDYAENPDSPITFGKVQLINSCYTNSTDTDNPNTFYGIFVDIMPLDGVPSKKLPYRLFWLHLRILLLLQTMVVQYKYRIRFDNEGVAKTFLRRLCGILSRIGLLNHAKLKEAYLSRASSRPFETAGETAHIWQFVSSAGVDVTKPHPVAAFESHIDMPFEDTTMRMPVGYKDYFAAVCPDYMTPPPKEKQTPHHHGILDFKKSYLEYAKEVKDSSR